MSSPSTLSSLSYHVIKTLLTRTSPQQPHATKKEQLMCLETLPRVENRPHLRSSAGNTAGTLREVIKSAALPGNPTLQNSRQINIQVCNLCTDVRHQ